MTEPLAQPPIPDLYTPKKSGNRFAVVIGSGIISTILTLVAVYFFDRATHENVMGWYADYVLPVGAGLVGLAASSGYAAASWITGLKVRRQLLLLIMALQVFAYFAAQYIQFESIRNILEMKAGRPIGFWEFYHMSTIHMSWKETGHQAPTPLGTAGYFVRAGELVGFVLGALVAPDMMVKAAYCDACERYMNRRELSVLPASTATPGLFSRKKSDPISKADALETGVAELADLVQLAGEANASGFMERLQPYRAQAKKNKKLAKRILLQMRFCKQCKQGKMAADLMSGQGKQIKTQSLGIVALTSTFVEGVLDGFRKPPPK